MSDIDKIFSGSLSKLYDTYLVPLIFEPYAADPVNRLRSRSLSAVLEIAAGTGVVTRAMASALPEGVALQQQHDAEVESARRELLRAAVPAHKTCRPP